LNQNKVWKLLPVLAIVLVLAGIWAIKNAGSLKTAGLPESPEASLSTESSSEPEEVPETENASGTENSADAESLTGTESSAGAESSAGTESSAGAESSAGTESSTGTESSAGAKSSAGTKSSTGAESSAGAKSSASTESSTGAENPTDVENPDFALEAEAIDLEQLASYGLPIVIDFGADWCGPCLKFAPILESVHDSMLGSAIIKYVDVDKSGSLAAEYPIRVIPTQVFFLADGTPYVPGEEIDTEFLAYNDKTTGERLFTVHEGALTKEELNAILADMGVAQ